MKKILLSALAILLAMGLIGSSFAYFSDTETSTANTFTAGTWDIEIQDGESLPLNLWNMKPGDSIDTTHWVQNVGSLEGIVWFTADNFKEPGTEWPAYIQEPEEPEPSQEMTAEEFADIVWIKIWADVSGEGSFDDDELLCNKSLLQLKQEGSDSFTIGAGEMIFCKFEFYMPGNLVKGTTGEDVDDNLYQADAVEFDIIWHGESLVIQ